MPTVNNKASTDARDSGPWWREPWPWILMAGPAVAVVGCIITIVLAFQNMGNQPIDDGGVKRGLVVSKQIQAPVPKESQE
ncbi:FixH family protein [Pusillimonas sp. SM2304]|uniref:FixH family protein n=1 Tax=Pusillimonas sp. SM2304 TaxID=3073241 RepID=UPI0028756173|nr:FixH family protein [Pusillimonas sp. SM2304]MDS1141911.1 FixH family protein [Pusillimonas sp. SM2304]